MATPERRYELTRGFGERLREARKLAGFSQEDLADMLKVTRSAVSLWEIEDTEPDDHHRMELLARILNVDVRWLCTGKGKGPAPIKVKENGRTMMERMQRLLATGQFSDSDAFLKAMTDKIATGAVDDALRRLGYIRRRRK